MILNEKFFKVAIIGVNKTSIQIADFLSNIGNYIEFLIFDEGNFVRLKESGFLVKKGNFLEEEALKEAIKDKDILFCMHKSSKINLFITFSAKYIKKDIKIIAIAQNEDEEKKLKLAGADKIILLNKIVAHKIVKMIFKPITLKIADEMLLGENEIKIVEFLITSDSKLNGKRI